MSVSSVADNSGTHRSKMTNISPKKQVRLLAVPEESEDYSKRPSFLKLNPRGDRQYQSMMMTYAKTTNNNVGSPKIRRHSFRVNQSNIVKIKNVQRKVNIDFSSESESSFNSDNEDSNLPETVKESLKAIQEKKKMLKVRLKKLKNRDIKHIIERPRNNFSLPTMSSHLRSTQRL